MTLGYPREEPSAGKPHARICEGEAEWLSYSTYANATSATRDHTTMEHR
jgi:hypothetical protein